MPPAFGVSGSSPSGISGAHSRSMSSITLKMYTSNITYVKSNVRYIRRTFHLTCATSEVMWFHRFNRT